MIVCIDQCADDGADDEFGRTWVASSRPFAAGPLGLKLEFEGLVGEHLFDGRFHWEAWQDCRAFGERYAEGYADTFDEAVAGIAAHWDGSPLEREPFTGPGYVTSSTAAFPWNR